MAISRLSSKGSKAIGLLAAYLLLLLAGKAVVLTLIGYISTRAYQNTEFQRDSLQKVNEMVQANQILTYGIAAFILALTLHFMRPISSTHWKDIFPLQKMKNAFRNSFTQAAVFCFVYLLAASLSKNLNYLGVYINLDEVVLSLLTTIAFIFAFFCISIVEEHILRQRIEPWISRKWGYLAAVAASSVAMLLIRYIQFDLDVLSALNFTALNVLLSQLSFRYSAKTDGTAVHSGVFMGVVFILLHILFGLPLLGQDMPGIFLLRPSIDGDEIRTLLSGGTQGPEGSLVLMILVMVYLYLPQLRNGKAEE